MKKLCVLFLFSSILFASVGNFVIVRGDVDVIRKGEVLKAKNAMKIENQDKIITKNAAKAQIKFSDDTIVTLGKNTTFEVSDYINENKAKKLHMGVSQGSFKVITGGIAKVSRDDFKFNANSAVIGVRGTIFAGDVGNKGRKDIIGCVSGAIDVKLNGKTERLNAGKMVEIERGMAMNIKSLDSSKIETINSVKQDVEVKKKDMQEIKKQIPYNYVNEYKKDHKKYNNHVKQTKIDIQEKKEMVEEIKRVNRMEYNPSNKRKFIEQKRKNMHQRQNGSNNN